MCRKKRPAHVDERAVSKASCTKCSSCPAASAYKGIKNPPILQENEWRKIAFNLFYVSAQNTPFVQPISATRSVTTGCRKSLVRWLRERMFYSLGLSC